MMLFFLYATLKKESRAVTEQITRCAAAFLCFCSVAAPALAAGELDDVLSGFDTPQAEETKPADELGDVLSGFDEQPAAQQDISETTALLPAWLQLFGELTLATSWNYTQDAPKAGQADFRDLSMLRTTASLGADIKQGSWRARISGHGFYDAVYSVQGRDQYTGKLLDEYEQELEFDEVYFSTSLTDTLDVKLGRQVVVWGKADNVRVTDILNPLDNRTPGMVDIKYRRLPVIMSKLDYYIGNWNINGLILHEVRFDKQPVFNSDFFPGTTPRPAEDIPSDFALDNKQYGLAVNGIFSGWDLSLYQAWVYDNRAHLSTENGYSQLIHNRVSMTGFTTNMASGNWLFKAEGAWWSGLEFAATDSETFSRIDLMAGIEYTGFSETVLSLETVNRHIVHFDPRLETAPDYSQRDEQQTVFMATRDFLNDTLTVKLLCSLFGSFGDDGAFERLQLDYDLDDHSTITGGIILYQAGDAYAFSEVDNNDRIFLEYSFAF